MRVLYFFCERFGLETHRKARPDVADDERTIEIDDAVVCLVHSESHDDAATVTKLIKNAKWIAGKMDSKRVVFHFFAHLGEDPGDPERARELLESARDRLAGSGYEAMVTPFGYFCRLDLGVHGESIAKVFKVF